VVVGEEGRDLEDAVGVEPCRSAGRVDFAEDVASEVAN
jgi:hypothetical protein